MRIKVVLRKIIIYKYNFTKKINEKQQISLFYDLNHIENYCTFIGLLLYFLVHV